MFVAVSIRAEFIARSVELRNRATQTGVLFLTGLPASLLLVIPEQERWLGLEFLVLAGVTGATALALDRRADGDTTGSRAGHLLDLATPNSACLLLAAAGLLLLLGQGGVFTCSRRRSLSYWSGELRTRGSSWSLPINSDACRDR